MRALVVEDDALLLDFVARCLKDQNFEVDTADDGNKGYKKARKGFYDVIVLDIVMPGMPGTEVCMKLRAHQVMTPILFLSANDSSSDKISGLNMGADDYLVKPFEYSELVARVKALSRRSGDIIPAVITYADLKIDTARREVYFKEKAIRLTPKEFQLLELLARNPETVLSREYLLKHIWGVTIGNTSNRLEVCILGLRKKLGNSLGNDLINTEYGVGYRLSQY